MKKLIVLLAILLTTNAYANKNPLDTMCPEPYVCVIPPLEDSEIKINPFLGLETYRKIEV